MQRRTTPLLAAVPAALLLSLAATAAPATAAPAAPAAAATVTSLFPTDALTVPDARQSTGRRVALPTAGCTGTTTCGLTERLNQLDGFDLDPRLALHFAGDVDVAAVVASTYLARVTYGERIGIDRVVYDRATHTVYAHPRDQLEPGTRYLLKVDGGRGLTPASTTFTTLSATDGLLDLRTQLDDTSAYIAAGIGDRARGLQVDAVVDGGSSTLEYVADKGSQGGLVKGPVFSLVGASKVVLGSYLAPSWLRQDRTFAPTPTGAAGPAAVRAERLPFVAVLPAGTAPAGGWPTAVFGHGFTRSDADVLLAAATDAQSGIATIATDVVGHGYGPRSTWKVTGAGGTRTVPAHARGVDLDGDGVIGSTEGSSSLITGPAAGVGSRDGLRQTALDNMTLLRAIGRGLDVGGTPASELRTTDVTYFGQSFGGIYGTMLAGADPKVARAALNVAGGPITEIARLSPSFRPLIIAQLKIAGLVPPAAADFQESLPLRGQGPVLMPAPGALAIQDYLAQATWLTRPGSPETFAPLVQRERALFQVAFGDQTVPNPTAYTLLDAGRLFGRASIYRNDRTPSAGTNPHSFLLDPLSFGQAWLQGQAQIATFLTTGQVIDPDGAGNVWEVPLDRSVIRSLNFGTTSR